MCAIGGIYLKDGRLLSLHDSLKSMLLVQRHRGPDAENIYVAPGNSVGLCHNRLAIVDLSDLANQPMQTQDGRYIITFNGEIYNWKELRHQLEAQDVSFYSHSDTEVILNGYREWGVEVLNKLRGMFAFAIWDNVENVLFCARDRIGKKPFIYGESSRGFFFASELPALKKINQISDLDFQLDNSALAAMLLHNIRHIPEPATVYRGIRKLRAGHALIVKSGQVKKTWRYWTPKKHVIQNADELRQIIEESVAIRSLADVPIGALLSGGIDSTAIVNLMQKETSEPVKTFAFGHNQNDEDLVRARFVSKELGTNHKEFYFDPDRQYKIFQKILRIYGEPIMLLPLIHAYELSEAIRNDNIKVVMNGNGADELFFGYTGHLRTARVTKYMNMLGWIRNFLPKINNPHMSVFFERPGKRKSMFYQHKSEVCWPSVLKPNAMDALENIASAEMEFWGDLLPNNDFIDESNYIALLVENSHSVTIASDLPGMMASIEMRSPFLDQKVIDAAMGIHYSLKVKGPKDGSQLKNILRKAVKDLVPIQVMNAPKRGFGMSIQEKDVLLNSWRKHADDLFSDYPEAELFDRALIKKQWMKALSGLNVDWALMSKLFAIGTWIRESRT